MTLKTETKVIQQKRKAKIVWPRSMKIKWKTKQNTTLSELFQNQISKW